VTIPLCDAECINNPNTEPQGSNTGAQAPGRLLLPLLLHLAGRPAKKAERPAPPPTGYNCVSVLAAKELTPQHKDSTQPGATPWAVSTHRAHTDTHG
jgi:hypothetical protein